MRIRIVLLTMLALGCAVLLAEEEKKSAIAKNPAYDKMKTLVGSWEGSVDEGGKQIPTKAQLKMMSDNSVLAHWLDEGSPHEMLTMFHMDGKDLMATHYCAAHNQPRMVLAPGNNPNRLVFRFKDGTNIGPKDGHMRQVTFVFDGPDHHIEEWTYSQDGKEFTSKFDFKRKQ
ncbi:MAG: hypothetical protein QOE73_2533 [Verrucomicrobiota bacterium]